MTAQDHKLVMRMNDEELALRQQRLLARSSQLRLALTEQTQALAAPLAMVDRVRCGLLWLYRNPHWPLGALLVLAVLRPRRVLTWGGRFWWAWRLYQRLGKSSASNTIQSRS